MASARLALDDGAMAMPLDVSRLIERMQTVQAELRDLLREHMRAQEPQVWSRTVRDDEGDTIFGLDAAIEDRLVALCEEWGREQPLRLVAEGLDSSGVLFGATDSEQPRVCLIADPIDGTRGLMFDKRSAWCLMAVAVDRGPDTSLSDIEAAVMTELPTTRQATSDVLWAARGQGAHGQRHDLIGEGRRDLPVVPSSSTTLRHGFATVSSFFQGGKELFAALDEAILQRALGPWNPDKAEVYCDQYISSGGQLAELALGRDRFVLDVRPIAYAKLGITSSLCCRPYDLCTALIAQEAGCVVTDPLGQPLEAPLDTTTNVAFAAYANATLAAEIGPIVRDEVQRRLL